MVNLRVLRKEMRKSNNMKIMLPQPKLSASTVAFFFFPKTPMFIYIYTYLKYDVT